MSPTREFIAEGGQVITDESIEAVVQAVVKVALEAIDDSGRDVNEHTRAAIKKHVAHRQSEFLRRMIR